MFNQMPELSDSDIFNELIQFYSLKNIAIESNISEKTLSQFVDSKKKFSAQVSHKLRVFFNSHVAKNSKKVKISELFDSSPKNYLVNSPDGFVSISTFYRKKPRDVYEIDTVYGIKLRCSHDHLVETSIGWLPASDVVPGMKVLSKAGMIEVDSCKKIAENIHVFDFEVAHENHRYYAGGGISSHNSGKSFTTANIIANAQKAGAFVLALDSENALSDDFVSKIGVQTSPDKWSYVGVSTIETVTAVLSEFITGYEKEYGRDNPDAPKVLIVLDSLDMLISNAESEKFEKGVQTSDMGTRTRLFKHLLRTVVNRIARTNMTMLVTHQVYLNQDVTNGHGEFIVNNAVRYSASQIAVFKPLKLKEGAEIKGIRIKAESYKSRFAQPGIKVEIEVPWETGMDPFSGTLDMLLDMGVITQGGAWYSATIGEETRKFQRKQLDEQLFQWLLTHPKIIEEENRFLSADQVEEQVSED